jgi:hypothetical protein
MTSRRLASFALLVLATAACTGTTSSTSGSPTSSPTASDSPIPSGPIVFVPGEYFIDYAEVRSDLTWNGGEGTLTVANASDAPLGAPGLYAVTGASTTVDADVESAAPVEPGDEATFTFTFPDSLAPDDAGLLVLSFGEESWGAMIPVVQE